MNTKKVPPQHPFSVRAYIEQEGFNLPHIFAKNLHHDFKMVKGENYIEVWAESSRDRDLVYSICRNLYGPVPAIYRGPPLN
jgi:hypothetical protein